MLPEQRIWGGMPTQTSLQPRRYSMNDQIDHVEGLTEPENTTGPTYSFTHDNTYYVAVPFEKAVEVLGKKEANKLEPDG